MENEKLNRMLEELWDSLTDEQKAKAKECESADELVELAGKEGIELPDEMLETVSGGLKVIPLKEENVHPALRVFTCGS